MKIDYLHELKSSYEEGRSFLRDEGLKEPQASHNREPSEIQPACYNEPETLLQKEKMATFRLKSPQWFCHHVNTFERY